MAGLTLCELKKRNNHELFLDKIKTGQKFELTNKKKAELKLERVSIDKALLPNLEVLDSTNPIIKNKKLLLRTPEGMPISSGALKKTKEFGGMTPEMIYQKEIKQQKSIEVLLKKITVFGLKPITLRLKTSLGNIYKFEQVFSIKASEVIGGQHKKTDFEFINKDGTTVFSISHKYGNKAKHFRQWSGLRDFHGHTEVAAFGKDLKDYMTQNAHEIFPPMFSVGREIKDPNLKKLAIFGNNEVDFMVQGECIFTKLGDFEFQLEASLVLARNESLETLPETHKPILLARRGDLKRGAFGIKGCRGMIYPQAGRKIHHYL